VSEAICFRRMRWRKGGVKRDIVIFKKRPNKLRIHVVENGLVVGAIGFGRDFRVARTMGKPARRILGRAAEALAESARFDDPIVGIGRAGSIGAACQQAGESPIRLRISEKDGTTWVETNRSDELQRALAVKVRKDGTRVETRFQDYSKGWGISMWPTTPGRSGLTASSSTTRVSDVSLDPGLLDRFLPIPKART